MKRIVLALTCIEAAFLSTLAAAPAQVLELERIAEVADSIAHAKLAERLVTGMTVAVAKDGEILFARGYGSADVEMDTGAAPETVYKIGSLTKQFTAAGIMRLVEQGKLSLEDSITKHLPGYETQGHRVTLRHLLNHTSGIKDYAELGDAYWLREFRFDLSEEEMVRLIADQPFDFEPGEQFRYCNSGYYLLGVIIGKVSGMPYAEYVERELLQPLGLSSIMYCHDRRIIPHLAEGYEYERDGTLVKAPYVSMYTYGAAGGLCSTAADLVRWTYRLHSGQVVSAASFGQMTAPTAIARGETVTYGFGLDLARLEDHQKIAHGGNVVGFSSYLVHYPETGLTIAVLTNCDEGMPGQMEEALARTAHRLALPEIRDLPLTAVDIARYEGTYLVGTGPQATNLRVFAEDGKLKVQVAGGRVARLRQQGDHVFIPVFDDRVRVVFTMENGRAESISLNHRGKVTQAVRNP